MNELYLAETWRYPIKSVGGERLPEAEITPLGVVGDRQFALVDVLHDKILSRKDPKNKRLLEATASIRGSGLMVAHPEVGELHDEIQRHSADYPDLTLLDETVSGVMQSRHFDEFFSDLLGRAVMLVGLPDNHERAVEPHFLGAGYNTAFTDGYPLTVVSTESLALIGEALGGVDQPNDLFRANFILEGGGEPFYEDMLHQLFIGTASLRIIKASSRCVMTEQGINEDGKAERMHKTLQVLRKQFNRQGFNGTNDSPKVMFAQNAIVTDGGFVREGGAVRVLSTGTSPNWSPTPPA